MEKARTEGGVHVQQTAEANAHSQEQLALMRTQDMGYINLKAQAESKASSKKEWKRSTREGGTVRRLGPSSLRGAWQALGRSWGVKAAPGAVEPAWCLAGPRALLGGEGGATAAAAAAGVQPSQRERCAPRSSWRE